ncbi:MAG: hypothetical protein CMP14_11410 [Rickettsiales bacterium]|jgi:L,D-peptidoglycan transpeptidase YkuD (ErfK/YbiS/YcfS/YnhG family)|nr:hypothetical protein [Rickettsiales bacterium]
MKLIVYPSGLLVAKNRAFKCVLGRSGIANYKVEGDGATPVGEFILREIFYRQDRLKRPKSGLPISATRPDDRWSDDPSDPDYNRLVQIPHSFRHESLWRKDSLYDIVVPIGYNDDPPDPGRGSAIFLHIAAAQYGPTEGCIALAQSDLLAILEWCDQNTALVIRPPAFSFRI